MEVDHVVVDAVLFVVHHIVRIIQISLHSQIAINERLSSANLNIDLIALLPLNLAVSNENFG